MLYPSVSPGWQRTWLGGRRVGDGRSRDRIDRAIVGSNADAFFRSKSSRKTKRPPT